MTTERGTGRIFSFVVLGLLLSSCGFDPFCRPERYSYRETVPIYIDPGDARKVESSTPRALRNPGKVYLHHDLILVNELEKGVHVFDNSNPRAPVAGRVYRYSRQP